LEERGKRIKGQEIEKEGKGKGKGRKSGMGGGI
jgi:hypothetical protein